VSTRDGASSGPGPAPRRRVDLAGPDAAPATERVPELDALRGLAALAVVVFHSNGHWLPFGWAAVDLFFVLSGYLITAIVLRHGSSKGFLRSFYVRRGLRVWPLYFLVVGLVVVFTPVLRAPAHWASLPRTLTFTQSVSLYWSRTETPFIAYLLHTWTLALEEQFYLLWPAVVLVVGPRRVVPLALACAVGSFGMRSAGFDWTLLAARCDGLALGGLLAALLASGHPTGRARHVFRLGLAGVVGAGLATLLAVRGFSRLETLPITPPRLGVMILAFNLVWLGTVGLTVLESGHPALAGLRRPGLCWLGQISYGLYLIHHVLLCIARDLCLAFGQWRAPRWLLFFTIALSIAVAGLSHRYFEAPILRWKRRFSYAGGPGQGRAGRRSRVPSAKAPAAR
jgi:peptidoglycan/LPS O-acetylase OafA/YrhL